MFYPDLNHVKKLSGKHNLIPVALEVYADMETPISIFKRFEESEYCFLLESVEGGEKWARYSFIGKNPYLIVSSKGNKVTIQDRDGRITVKEGNPISILKSIMQKYKSADIPGMPRFCGGAVGFFGYDLIRHYENLPDVPRDDIDLPESHFMFADELIAFDHLKQKMVIIVNMHVDMNIERSYNTAVSRLKEIYHEIISKKWKSYGYIDNKQEDAKKQLFIQSNMTKEEYCSNVEIAKQYIKDGDIFQVVLSQRFSAETDVNPVNVYRALRISNPSPYMYYLKFGDYSIAGASPEMLVRVENGTVETCPIAGTRGRGRTIEEDEELERELLEDDKELAEHMMLVDLGRNDLGKVSKFGSVKVMNLKHIEKYSHVMHIVTNVQGVMREDKDAFDALIAVMPAGTVSGAPKVRAMQIIDELENVKRGVYSGAIGYLSFNGNLDSCITIRTVIFKGKKAYIQAGAGIVADSVPEREYEETLKKAKAILKALEEAGEIL